MIDLCKGILINHGVSSLKLSVVIILLLLLTKPIMNRYTAGFRYYSWLAVIIIFLIPFQSLGLNYKIDVTPEMIQINDETQNIREWYQTYIPKYSVAEEVTTYETAESGEVKATTKSVTVHRPINLFGILTFVWIFGCLTYFALHFKRYVYYKRTIKRFSIRLCDEKSMRVLEYEKNRLKIKKDLPLKKSGVIDTPMLLGILHPEIILPHTAYAENELHFILRHELYHYKRKDILYQFITLVFVSLHWFNPFVYFMAKAVEIDGETSCDEKTLIENTYDEKIFYGEMLIHFLKTTSQKKSYMTTTFFGGKRGMKKRLTLITSKKARKKGTIAMAVVTLLAVMLSVTVCAARPIEFAPTKWFEDKDGNFVQQIMPMNDLYYASESVALIKRNESVAVAYDMETQKVAYQIDFWMLGLFADYDDPMVVIMGKDEDVVKFYKTSAPETVFKYYVKKHEITVNDYEAFVPADACEKISFYVGADKTVYFDKAGKPQTLADLGGWNAEEGIRINDNTICYLVNVTEETNSGDALRLCLLSDNGNCDVRVIPMNSNSNINTILPDGYKGGYVVNQRLALNQLIHNDTITNIAGNFKPQYRTEYDESTGNYNQILVQLEQLQMPVDGEIISHFHDEVPEYANERDIYGDVPYFSGIEISAPENAPVRAAAEGTVVKIIDGEFAVNEGKMLLVRHSVNEFTVYGSLKDIQVQVGDWVTSGQRIATVGATSAHSNKSHLYFAYLTELGGEDVEKLLK